MDLMEPSHQSSNNGFLEAFPTLKVTEMKETLSQAVVRFSDLTQVFENLVLENNNYKELFHEQQKLISQPCSTCDQLLEVVASKEDIIDSIGTILKRLVETNDLNLIKVTLKQLCDETYNLTPPDSASVHEEHFKNLEPPNECKEMDLEQQNRKEQDESLSEIESTPTGRKSPVFQTRKAKTNSLSLKDKKKCSESWPTPENKAVKLTYPTPTRSKAGGRMRQGRLSFIKMKSSNMVDLTCSPENSGESCKENNMQCTIKQEVIDNDETILPSPTSAAVIFPSFFKSMAKNSPTKFKKPSVYTKFKIENDTSDHNFDGKLITDENGKIAEDSINLLNQFCKGVKSPIKQEKLDDETRCGDESISLLQHVKRIDKHINSPSKRPLAENINVTNEQNRENNPSISIPLYQGNDKAAKGIDRVKRLKANAVPVYKEPTVRKKAEKRALPGWSCDDCRLFYDELYKHDPAMLAQKMDECSKHRGRSNPARPKTPDGFWNPRWDVPHDTEEFNRRNNAV